MKTKLSFFFFLFILMALLTGYGGCGDNTHSHKTPRCTSTTGTTTGRAKITQISAGAVHTCALTTAGDVKCWGDNSSGQLGNGSSAEPEKYGRDGCSASPLNVVELSGVSAISAGGEHTCALTTAGGVKCWGENHYGQLGNGSREDSTKPVDVVGLSDVSAVSAGSHYTCALTKAGAVKCWGCAYLSKSGYHECSPIPVNVSGLASGVSAVSAGGHHTCALTRAGRVKCWGYNDSGQLGNGSETKSSISALDVTGLSGVSAISVGAWHTCTLTTAVRVKCWGGNFNGQLGNGSVTISATPDDITGVSSVSAVSAGGGHTCVLTKAGRVKCWGYNWYGQLGNGRTTDSSIPVGVIGFGG